MEMLHIFSMIILITLFLLKEKFSDNITGKFTRWTQIWGTLSYLLTRFSVFRVVLPFINEGWSTVAKATCKSNPGTRLGGKYPLVPALSPAEL